jgi:beta-N-acetylhexosaminidase
MLDTNPFITPTLALRTFLSQSAGTLKDKRVIVFALAAPYYLDATEISKVTAYYGVYSRTPIYLEAAMRALFGEFVPAGDSPVSIPGLNYSLIVQTAPDPAQVIPLIPLMDGDVVTDTQATPAPLALKIGDRLKLRAGPIYDKNSHIVPDGTQVQFILSYPAERVEQRLMPVSTRDGVADTTVALERQGKLEIRAEAEPATTSYVVLVDTTDVVSIETIRPTATPTVAPQPTATLTEQPTPTVEATTALPLVTQPPPPPSRASLLGFVLALLGLLVIGGGLFVLLSQVTPVAVGVAARLRVAVGVWLAGWLAYILAVLQVPGTRWASEALGWGGPTLLAIALGLIAAVIILAAAIALSRQRPNSANATNATRAGR